MKRMVRMLRLGGCQTNWRAYYESLSDAQLVRQKQGFRNLYIGLFGGWFAFFGFLLWQSSFDGVHVALFTSILPMIIALEEDLKKRRKIINEILNRRQH